MRIIAGEFKGRTLKGPTGSGVRPTSDGLRETLFNILRDRVAHARVIDAYAGTGSVGLEALSRGAAHATFIERDPGTIRVLTENVRTCRAEGITTIVRDDVLKAAGRNALKESGDLVFADPPYDVSSLDDVLAALAALVTREGLVILEYSKRRDTPPSVGGLTRGRVHVAGDSALAFYTSAPTF